MPKSHPFPRKAKILFFLIAIGLSPTFEQIIDEHRDSYHPILDFQFGNRMDHWVGYSLLILKTNVLLEIDHKALTKTCLFNIRKLFDSLLDIYPHLCKLILISLDGRQSRGSLVIVIDTL